VSGLALKAAIDYLFKLCAVSIRVELAFLATDAKNHGGTAGPAPDNTGLSRFAGKRTSLHPKVHPPSIGEIGKHRSSTDLGRRMAQTE
jgi:hypothetical protein